MTIITVSEDLIQYSHFLELHHFQVYGLKNWNLKTKLIQILVNVASEAQPMVDVLGNAAEDQGFWEQTHAQLRR